MSRKIQEGKFLEYIIKVFNIFESEKYSSVEEFVNRCKLNLT